MAVEPGELKFNELVLQTLRPTDDALRRRVDCVELLLGKKRFLEEASALAEQGTSGELALGAMLQTQGSVLKCPRKDGAGQNVSDYAHPVIVDIPQGTTEICDKAFCKCNAVTYVMIPNSVTRIGAYSFAGCSRLTSVSIPDSVNKIDRLAFFASGLTSLTIPESVAEIGHGAFQDCRSLTSLTILNGVTAIRARAFFGCSSLTCVTIPNSVTYIAKGAFENCTSLKRLSLPAHTHFEGLGMNCVDRRR